MSRGAFSQALALTIGKGYTPRSELMDLSEAANIPFKNFLPVN